MVTERFRVWAPNASDVQLVPGDGSARFSLQPEDGGWWGVSPDRVIGDYGFSVDGDGPFPDPRSRWQPDGVHGVSRTFDPAAHHWQDQHWRGRQLAGSIIYELHLGTFTPEGTLDAAAARLDHLVDLGVDFVELLPVNAFNGPYNWGYDGVLWYAVHEEYGGPAAYQRFVDACHAVGIGVIQDVVYNHLGPSGNILPHFGPYLSEADGTTWGASVNLDGAGSDEVRRYILDNATMWLRDYHVDGLRLDAVHAFADRRAVHLLEELAGEVDALSASVGRPLSLIAESDLNDPRLITPRPAGGFGLTAQWNDDFHHAVHVALTGETSGYYADFAPLDALGKVLADGFFHDGSYSSFRGRHHGRPLEKERTPSWRLVVAAQNHDQIGNRAAGERLTATLDAGQLAIAAAFTLLGPFTPMLFMGEEWGATTPWQFFTSHPEPELAQATATGRIAEFARMGWDPGAVPDPQDPATFARSRLDWGELVRPEHQRLLALYRDLIAVRRRHPQFTDPRLSRVRVTADESDRVVALHRGDATVLANLGLQRRLVATPAGRQVLSFAPGDTAVREHDDHQLDLAAHSIAVFVP